MSWFGNRAETPSAEQRDADATDRVAELLLTAAQGGAADPKRTAAVVAAAGLYSRSFAGLVPSVTDPRIDVAYLARVGHEIAMAGASYRLIERERLVTVQDVAIGSDSRGVVYFKLRPKYPGRAAGDERTVPEAQVIAVVPPGMGVSRRGHTTSALAAIERRLERDAALPSLALQVQKDIGASMGAKAAVAAAEAFGKLLKGDANVVPAPPGHEVKVLETNPLGLSEQRRDLERSTLASLGVPAELLHATGGASIRESFRQFCRITIAPLAGMAAFEIGRKLGLVDYALSTARLGGFDTASISRSVKGLVEAGLTLDAALEIAGL